ncbi:ABC transporter substrate-binding protein [Chloroflexota bacterium]
MGTWNPHRMAANQDSVICDMLFNALIRVKPGEFPNLEPEIAKSMPEMSINPITGQQQWIFELREGIMTHPFEGYPNGYEITSEDIVYSLNRATSPDTSNYAAMLAGMKVEAMGDYQVVITLEKAQSSYLFLNKLTDSTRAGYIVPKKAMEARGEQRFATEPIGTGPFMVDIYKTLDRVELVAHKNYFRGQPKIDRIVARYIPELSTREIGLKTGELDAIELPRSKDSAERAMAEEGITVDVFGPGSNDIFMMDISKPPFDNKKLREAVAYAIDRTEYAAYYGAPPTRPSYSVIPELLPGGLTKEAAAAKGLLYEFDLEKAKSLMIEAGYADGLNLECFASPRSTYKPSWEIIQSQLKRIGINLELKWVDHSTYHKMQRADNNRLALYNCWRDTPDVYYSQFWHSDAIVVTGKAPNQNFTHYDKVDAFIEQARVELDSDKQAALWGEANAMIMEDLAGYAFLFKEYQWARSENFDWGHPVKAAPALYPQITENSFIK